MYKKVNGYGMFLNIQVKGISRTLAVYGEHEKLETELVRQILSPGMVALDIGANIGYYALLEASLLGPNGLVYALEPYPRNYELLRQNISLNNYQSRIRTFPVAAGDVNGTSKLYVGPSDNRHSLLKLDKGDFYKDYIEVDTVTVDSFFTDKGKIDFVRMDLEGFECQVIAGMKDTAKRHKPSIFFEIHPMGTIDPDPRYTDCLDDLLAMGYQPKTLVCPAHRSALYPFRTLGYHPTKIAYNGMLRNARYDDIKPSDLIKVAARRPKITRAIYMAV